MKTNRDIKSLRVRVISEQGKQMGIYLTSEAVKKAEELGLDLVEISPKADPPVCKIIDYGKFCYQQTKRDKDQRKGSVQGKVKEVKFKPNIDTHDLQVKIKRAKEFLEKGFKVKFTCMFRGREIVFVENGRKVMNLIIEQLNEIATPDSGSKMMGRMLTMLMTPGVKEKKIKPNKQKTNDPKEEK
ncbi:MAG: Translation initiation factor IF-3 [Chlamydiia bacterium]|nr:Translation initiation factor IF-3 [Chlamydiia bacterium]MCH9618018.1 Translation initiation factor IF-3 [Chlamydiia bacterium]MCH9623657.1 Translation initiation factor IF-3 [Chlamydiia bacterium]